MTWSDACSTPGRVPDRERGLVAGDKLAIVIDDKTIFDVGTPTLLAKDVEIEKSCTTPETRILCFI
jgi:hypothetical protein